jgi:chitinase
MKFLKKIKKLVILSIISSTTIQAQLPSKVLVGYWHNWETLRIKDVDTRYNVICLSFLEADKNNKKDDNTVEDLEFTPTSATQLKSDIPIVQAEGKKVLISIGGANGSFKLNSVTDKNTYVTKVKDFITEYKVDGIDIDIERTPYICHNGTQSMSSAATHFQYLIDGTKELLTWYKATYNKKMILTTAPEISYTTGGLSPWNDCNGVFLPFIEQLRDDIDLLMIQLYNSGSVYSIPGFSSSNNTEYTQGTADFVVVSTEAAIEGFTPKNTKVTGKYTGLPASKVVVALPACANSWNGYVTSEDLKKAMAYLMGTGTKAGNYTLSNSYPNLRGLMTWSINNDAKTTCGGAYTFAQTFEDIYGTIDNSNSVSDIQLKKLNLYPNPAKNQVTIHTQELIGKNITISDFNGRVVKTILVNNSNTIISINDLANGFYTVKSSLSIGKLIVKK